VKKKEKKGFLGKEKKPLATKFTIVPKKKKEKMATVFQKKASN
jgi:hypothetical protein